MTSTSFCFFSRHKAQPKRANMKEVLIDLSSKRQHFLQGKYHIEKYIIFSKMDDALI